MKLLLLLFLFSKPQSPKDTLLNKSDYFIAMEYKGFSNCIYKVFVTDSLIMGAKVNGYISVQSGFGIGTSIPTDVMHDPEAYVNKKMEAVYPSLLNDNKQFFSAANGNFIIRKKDIKAVFINQEKKWGMGYYPQSGRIMIQTIKTEFNKLKERDLYWWVIKMRMKC